MAVRGGFFYLWSQHRIFRQLIISTDERRVRLALSIAFGCAARREQALPKSANVAAR
jgi:hypothetical protein